MIGEDKTPDFFRRVLVQKSRTDVYFWFQMFFINSRLQAELDDEVELYWEK